MELTEDLKTTYIATAEQLKGSDRRLFMARIAKAIGSQRRTAALLGWNRGTIRKGTLELETGLRIEDNFSARGRKRAEAHLPQLLEDITAIADPQSQTDATFNSTRLYARLSAAQVRRALIEHHGYTDDELPCEETIRVKLNALSYRLRSVEKSRPKKNTRDRRHLRPASAPAWPSAPRQAHLAYFDGCQGDAPDRVVFQRRPHPGGGQGARP